VKSNHIQAICTVCFSGFMFRLDGKCTQRSCGGTVRRLVDPVPVRDWQKLSPEQRQELKTTK
jgi:hypothetical protein